MGDRSRKRNLFLAQHPTCAFCGATRPSETVEHCPPRGMFLHRVGPVGFEFPACDECNGGTSDDDLVVAVLSRMDPLDLIEKDDDRLDGLMKALRKQKPGLLESMLPSANEARRHNAQFGIKPGPGLTHHEATRVLRFSTEIAHSVAVFSRKLAKAIFYKETKSIFPACGSLVLAWETNEELVLRGAHKIFEHLKDLPGNAPPIVRNRNVLAGQFSYKWTSTSDLDRTILQARIGHGLALVIMGSVVSGVLEATFAKLDAGGGQTRLMILQSSTLPTFDA